MFAHDLTDAIESNLKPFSEARDFKGALARQLEKGKLDGEKEDMYSPQEMRDTVESMVTENNFRSLLHSTEAWGAGADSFAQVLRNADPSLWNVMLEGDKDKNIIAMLDTDPDGEEGPLKPDGILTQVELDAGDIDAVITAMEDKDNFKIVKEMMIQYGIDRGKKNHIKGTKNAYASAAEKAAYDKINK